MSEQSGYERVAAELDRKMRKRPQALFYHICQNWTHEERQRVASQFNVDGYEAQATDVMRYGCGRQPEALHCVTVLRREQTQ